MEPSGHGCRSRQDMGVVLSGHGCHLTTWVSYHNKLILIGLLLRVDMGVVSLDIYRCFIDALRPPSQAKNRVKT